MLTVLIQLAALIWVFVLPGTWIALWAGETWDLPLRLAAGFTIGLLVMPLAGFCSAWILGTSVTPAIMLGLASIANIAGATVWWLDRPRRGVTG